LDPQDDRCVVLSGVQACGAPLKLRPYRL